MTRLLLLASLTACSAGPAAVTVAPVASSSVAPVSLDEHYDDLGCGVFAKGGAAESATALRRCLERTVPKDACASGGSPDLATLELAVSLIDGTGGPADVPRARELLARCFADASVLAVLTHAGTRGSPLDSCDAYAQTTLAMTDCATEHAQSERAWMRRIRHELPSDARPLFDVATAAYEVYARKLGEVTYDRYAGGTARSPAMADEIRSLLHERRVRLQTIRTFVASPVTPEELASARETLRDRLAAAEGAEPEAKQAVAAASHAFLPYRDAEIALYERLHPGSRAAVTLMLGREHAAHLCGTIPP